MDHYAKALELMGRADKCETCREAYGEADQNVLLLAALTHAVLALTAENLNRVDDERRHHDRR